MTHTVLVFAVFKCRLMSYSTCFIRLLFSNFIPFLLRLVTIVIHCTLQGAAKKNDPTPKM